MAFLKLDRQKLKTNYDHLEGLFSHHGISWGVVSKMLCGNKTYLKELLDLGVEEIHDSRISNLKAIKQIKPEVQTVYIKPAPKRSIASVVRYADVSLNTEYETIRMLSEEAVRQDKKHMVIIMIELGDLREGVMGEELIDFYSQIFELPNIEVIGLGANLNCLSGVMPSQDKLIQLSLYKQLIEAHFKIKIPWVSGGTSVTLPLMEWQQVPRGVNHFRIGETLYFGNNLFSGDPIEGMETGVLKLYAEIIELTEKPVVPIGELSVNPSGEMAVVKEEDFGKTSYRAIIDVGLLDISPDFLIPENPNISVSGASSDMLVLDLGEDSDQYEVGGLVAFDLKYMGALSLMSSRYIDKVVS
jgi:predicted amino acid racemase